MLTLTRKLNDQIFILCPDGNTITAKLTKMKPHSVSISFDAPPEYRIYREEILGKDQQNVEVQALR